MRHVKKECIMGSDQFFRRKVVETLLQLPAMGGYRDTALQAEVDRCEGDLKSPDADVRDEALIRLRTMASTVPSAKALLPVGAEGSTDAGQGRKGKYRKEMSTPATTVDRQAPVRQEPNIIGSIVTVTVTPNPHCIVVSTKINDRHYCGRLEWQCSRKPQVGEKLKAKVVSMNPIVFRPWPPSTS